jgi:hypothetical protein
MSNGAHSAKSGSAVLPPPKHAITHAALIEYVASRAVTELVVVEFKRGSYRLEVSLSWREGKSVLVAARGAERTFRSLDTLAKFLLSIGVSATVVRLELKP